MMSLIRVIHPPRGGFPVRHLNISEAAESAGAAVDIDGDGIISQL
jgi:hypothetical protein